MDFALLLNVPHEPKLSQGMNEVLRRVEARPHGERWMSMMMIMVILAHRRGEDGRHVVEENVERR